MAVTVTAVPSTTKMARIEKGNPAQVEEQLRTNREKVKARLSQQQTTSR
jgi:hypothetical protein